MTQVPPPRWRMSAHGGVSRSLPFETLLDQYEAAQPSEDRPPIIHGIQVNPRKFPLASHQQLIAQWGLLSDLLALHQCVPDRSLDRID
jgi:hypothetical protein